MLSRYPVHSYPPSKRTGLKAQFAPTEHSWAGSSESCTAKGSLVTEFGTMSTVRAMGWELDRQELSTWDYLHTGRSPFPGRVQTSGKWRTYPTPTSCRMASTASRRDLCKISRTGSGTPCRVHIHRRKTGRETPKGLILHFSQGDKIHWYLEPYSTEASKAGKLEISAAKGNQGPTQPWLSHRAVINTKKERADPLTQIGPSLKTSETIYYRK